MYRQINLTIFFFKSQATYLPKIDQIKHPVILFLHLNLNMNSKEILNPSNFAAPMGAYSHGLKINIGTADMFFVTGQIAMDGSGQPIAPDDISKQTEFILENIQKILSEGGASLDDVVKAVVYVTDISKYKEISAIRNKYFANAKPVSTLVEISRTFKEGCDIEIEVIAIKQHN